MYRVCCSHAATGLLAGIALMASVGCGNDKQLVPVSGRVTYGGGEWPMAGNISFAPGPSTDGAPIRPGSARFDKEGTFVVGSYKPEDGLMPGVYSVNVSCVDPSDFTKTPEELDIVPQDYRPEELVVEAGMDPIVLSYDVPKKE